MKTNEIIERDYYEEGMGTGSHDKPEKYVIISYPFNKYDIKIKVDQDNKFVSIIEVSINKDFQSYKQKMVKGYHDIDKYYE